MAARRLLWPVLILAGSLAACGGGPPAESTDPGGEPAPPATESVPAAAPPKAGPARPGPLRQGVPGTAIDSNRPRVTYHFAHAKFSLKRDERGRPLGVYVESVLPNGSVYWAGVKEGDLMTLINRVPLNDPRTFENAVRLAEDEFNAGRPQRINIVRDGAAGALIPLGPVKTEPVSEPQP